MHGPCTCSVLEEQERHSWSLYCHRYIDAGQALMESACSVERVDEQLSVLLPMIPGCKYFRFQPTDADNCDQDLDETDPEALDKLVNATKDYIHKSRAKFEEVEYPNPFDGVL
jgi:hypothetical protein